MSTTVVKARGAPAPLASSWGSLPQIAFRLLGLGLIDAFALWFLYLLVIDGVWFLAAAIAVLTLTVNVIFLREDLYPIRWMAPGLVLMGLMLVYPLLFTVYTAFTNYGDGHLLTKKQAIRLLEKQRFLPEGQTAYSWTAFRSPGGDYALWLQSPSGETLLARRGEPARTVAPGEAGVGPVDEKGVPTSLEGYRRLERIETVRFLAELGKLEFGEPPNTIEIASLDKAARFEQRYVYDEKQDAILDRSTGQVYPALEGTFTSAAGQTLRPGSQVTIGAKNFQRLIESPALRGPFVRVFLWTVAHAFFTVLITFSLGLFLAVVFNTPEMPLRKLVRSLLIIPYAIPGFISILIWRGLFNPHLGFINTSLAQLFGWSPPWFSDPFWVKVGILLVQLWLGFPYMLLITSGALQAIDTDLYEAAELDGAGIWQKFRGITLPLLLISVGPLLVGGFAFNFNNFVPVYLFNRGGPPISGTLTPAGHSDILISYTYRLAFAGARGSDLGYAAAITIAIFLILLLIVAYQFRYTRMWEETSENV